MCVEESSKERAIRILIKHSKELKSMTELEFNKKSNEIRHGVMVLEYGETKEDKMSKINKMEDVAKILGKELEEKFMIKDKPYSALEYKLTYDGLKYYKNCSWRLCELATLRELLVGKFKIEWIPKDEEKVWIIYPEVIKPVNAMFNENSSHHTLMLKRGLITKTEQEAIEKMKGMGWL